jgi:RNA-directed DNA polymerase
VLKLIRSYLEAGVMADGVKQPTEEGTPQGSPLSPLLSNVYLDDLDRMLTQRGHRFVRYADDITIYVASKRAAKRVMAGTCEFIEQRLKLLVNHGKSAVDHATRRTLLGFGFLKRGGEVKIRFDPKAHKRAKDRLRRLTSRKWGISMERRIAAINRFSRGWTAYFALADAPSVFEELDEWLRRRLRQVRWKDWKKLRTKHRNLMAAGIPYGRAYEWANSRKGYWRIAGSGVLARGAAQRSPSEGHPDLYTGPAVSRPTQERESPPGQCLGRTPAGQCVSSAGESRSVL